MNSARRIVFLDTTCPVPYDAETLQTCPQGGTESTVTRIAEALASRGYDAIVAQHNRFELGQGKATYLGMDHLDHLDEGPPHAVVVLRSTKAIPWVRDKWGGRSKLFAWLHDFNLRKREKPPFDVPTLHVLSDFEATLQNEALEGSV